MNIETKLPGTIVDGGMLSNFPVWLFDVDDRDATRPTFGFRLTGGKGVGGGIQNIVNGLGWPVQLGSEMFHTAMEAWDKRFMSHSTAVRTCPVDAGTIGSTEFAPHEGAAGLAAQLRQDRGGRVPRGLHARGLRQHLRKEAGAGRRARVR